MILFAAQALRLHAAVLTPIEGFSKRKPVVVRTNAQPDRMAGSRRFAPFSPLTAPRSRARVRLAV